MAQARDVDHGDPALGTFLRLCEQVARAQAVAHGARTDANAILRQLEIRVERDDLRHFSATDVHVIG
jgi:hypothetical protein